MTCLVLACLTLLATDPASGTERVQEQFEYHFLQDPRLAGCLDEPELPPLVARVGRPAAQLQEARP